MEFKGSSYGVTTKYRSTELVLNIIQLVWKNELICITMAQFHVCWKCWSCSSHSEWHERLMDSILTVCRESGLMINSREKNGLMCVHASDKTYAVHISGWSDVAGFWKGRVFRQYCKYDKYFYNEIWFCIKKANIAFGKLGSHLWS